MQDDLPGVAASKSLSMGKGGRKPRAPIAEEFDSDLSDPEEDDEEEEEEDGLDSGPSGAREPIYNTEGLHEKLEDIGWAMEAPWEETLIITDDNEEQVVDNVDDDLERELAFYNQALSATHAAIAKFEQAGVPWKRPLDYFAEMVKTDFHMNKVKDQLMHEQKQIELAEERRKQREQKQYSKQVQAERIKQKQQDKKRQIDNISKLRKSREKSGFAGELDMDAEIRGFDRADREREQQQAGRGPGGRKMLDRNRKGGDREVNKKRQSKDSKYGFGGRKALKKQNDAYSSADMDGYKGNKGGKGAGGSGGKFGGKGGSKFGGSKGGGLKAKGGVKKPAQRPGKARRQGMKGGGKGR